MRFTRIKETCLYVSDLQRTIEFYRDRLGLELFAHEAGRHAFFRAGTSVLLCFDPEVSGKKSGIPRHFAHGEIHLAFEVTAADYDGWKELITRQGISIEHEHQWGNGRWSFYFRDPDRHCLEIVQEGMWDD